MTPTAWVISLQERPDRLAAFRARAAAADLVVNELIVPRSRRRREGWGGSPESCGCAEAHLQILSGNVGPLLVFEDDAVIPPGVHGYVDIALQMMPVGWELCLLGAGWLAADHYAAGLGVVPISRFALTHAYLVSERGRPHLQGCAAKANHHWDDLASRRMCGRGHVYGFIPTIIEQDQQLGSDIPDSAPKPVKVRE